MYAVSEQQIEYILNDIRRNGVEMEDLQLNLLDHICCIVEQNLKDGDDFESFYRKTVKQFYKNNLWEIEEETIKLLTFKNYYAMKKSMIISGATAVVLLIAGSLFKIMHWPGAGPQLVFGIGMLSFVFLPLLFVLKTRDSGNARDKLITGLGVLMGILLCMSTLFKVMHWPGGNILWVITSAVSIFIFIPIYFFSGIRKAETKVNTIITTIILIGATGLLFTLTSIRKSRQLTNLFMYDYLRNEQLISSLQNKFVPSSASATEIQNTCEKIKSLIIETEIGMPSIPADFENRDLLIYEGGLGEEFNQNGTGDKLLSDLKALIEKYNAAGHTIPIEHTVLEKGKGSFFVYSNFSILNCMTQIQLFLATAEMKQTGVAQK